VKILPLIPLLLLLSCNLENTQQSNLEDAPHPTHEEIMKRFEEVRAFISVNPSVERGELPLMYGQEAEKMYDVIRVDFDRGDIYGHTYSVTNFSEKFIVSYKCQVSEKFCSLGFFHRKNYPVTKKWDKLVASLSDETISKETDSYIIINIETLIDGVYRKIHARPDSPDHKAWDILDQMRAICLPEIPKDTVPNELTNGCICDASRKVVTDRKK